MTVENFLRTAKVAVSVSSNACSRSSVGVQQEMKELQLDGAYADRYLNDGTFGRGTQEA